MQYQIINVEKAKETLINEWNLYSFLLVMEEMADTYKDISQIKAVFEKILCVRLESTKIADLLPDWEEALRLQSEFRSLDVDALEELAFYAVMLEALHEKWKEQLVSRRTAWMLKNADAAVNEFVNHWSAFHFRAVMEEVAYELENYPRVRRLFALIAFGFPEDADMAVMVNVWTEGMRRLANLRGEPMDAMETVKTYEHILQGLRLHG